MGPLCRHQYRTVTLPDLNGTQAARPSQPVPLHQLHGPLLRQRKRWRRPGGAAWIQDPDLPPRRPAPRRVILRDGWGWEQTRRSRRGAAVPPRGSAVRAAQLGRQPSYNQCYERAGQDTRSMLGAVGAASARPRQFRPLRQQWTIVVVVAATPAPRRPRRQLAHRHRDRGTPTATPPPPPPPTCASGTFDGTGPRRPPRRLRLRETQCAPPRRQRRPRRLPPAAPTQPQPRRRPRPSHRSPHRLPTGTRPGSPWQSPRGADACG